MRSAANRSGGAERRVDIRNYYAISVEGRRTALISPKLPDHRALTGLITSLYDSAPYEPNEGNGIVASPVLIWTIGAGVEDLQRLRDRLGREGAIGLVVGLLTRT